MKYIHNPADVAPPRSRQPYRPALGLQLLCQTLDELGLDANGACGFTGLSRQFLETPGQLITRDQEIAFIDTALAGNGREDLAFRVGLRYHYGVFGVWGLALVTSENLLQAMQVAQEFIELTHSFAGLSLKVDRGIAEIALLQDYPAGAVQAFVIERDLMITLMLASEAAGRRLPVERVNVSLPEPTHSGLLERLLDCKVYWGAETTAAYILIDELKMPLPQANAITWSACVRQCRELIAIQRGGQSFQSQVREGIAQTHFRGITAVCALLAVSERSLRRRLRDEGTSFRELQQLLRRELADQYLVDVSLSLEQIAERLGYSETANFCHAYKRWTGTTPGEQRRVLTEWQRQ
ncbi:MAG: AraC-like DNA-binding protein [Bermanella sp.]|jgi:AraC-like DNA-binding protein